MQTTTINTTVNAETVEALLAGAGTMVKKWSRWTGTGYKSEIRQLDGRFYQIDFNRHNSDGFWNEVTEIANPAIVGRAYAAACRTASTNLNIGFECVMAVGPGCAAGLAWHYACNFDKMIETYIHHNLGHELTCGISRRKAALKILLSFECEGLPSVFESCGISEMGQLNTTRVADELIKEIEGHELYINAMRKCSKDVAPGVLASEVDSEGNRTWSF